MLGLMSSLNIGFLNSSRPKYNSLFITKSAQEAFTSMLGSVACDGDAS
jgi:hypothetical protein